MPSTFLAHSFPPKLIFLDETLAYFDSISLGLARESNSHIADTLVVVINFMVVGISTAIIIIGSGFASINIEMMSLIVCQPIIVAGVEVW